MAPVFRLFLATILNPMLFAPQSYGGESILPVAVIGAPVVVTLRCHVPADARYLCA